MEREYFRDRPELVQFNKNIGKGHLVYIWLKKMQPFAKEISDLTLTKVTANLTTQYQHPRGQKIRGEKQELDKFGNKLYQEQYEEVVGRCTYLLDDNEWSFDTTEGKKLLIYNSNKGKLDVLPHEQLKGFLKIYILLKRGRVSFKIPFCKFTYFKDVSIAQSFIDKIVLEEIEYNNSKIKMKFNGIHIFEDKIEFFLDNERTTDEQEVFDYLCYTQQSKNNTTIKDNKIFELEVENFLLEKIL